MADRFLEDAGAAKEVRAFTERVWDSVSEEIDDRWLGTLEIPVAAERLMGRMDSIVAWAMNNHDGKVEDNVALEKYTPDAEPVPARIDPWARGVVAVRKAPTMQSDTLLSTVGGNLDSPNGTPSVSSYRSSRTGNSASKRGSSRAGSNKGGGAYEAGTNLFDDKEEDTGPEIFDIDDDGDDFSVLNKTGDMFNKIMRQMKKDNTVDDGGEDEEDEFRALQEEVERIANTAKGKKYTFDSSGQPIYINPVKAERLPPFAVAPGLNITSRQDDGGPSPSSSARNKKGGKKIKVAGAREIDSSYFTATNDLASSMAEAEPAVMPGVTLRVGDKVREGPAVPEDPKKVSRKQFFSRGGSQTLVGDPSMMGASAGGRGDGAMSPDSDFGDSMDMGDDMLPLSMLQAKYKDIDPFEGARKTSLVEGDDEGSYDDSSQSGKPGKGAIQGQGVRLPVKASAAQQANIKLMTGGYDNPGLRDRAAPVAQKEPSQYKKLPAPPMGLVSIYNSVAEGEGGPDSPSVGGRGVGWEASGSQVLGGGKNINSPGDSVNSRASKGGRSNKGGGQGSVKQERKDLTRALF